MDGMRNFTVTAYVDGRHRMCRISAELPERNEPGAGLRSVRFAFTERELEHFAMGQSAISDIVHQVLVLGDDCLFFDLDFPAPKRGVLSVPYYRAFIPRFVRRIVLRLVRRIWIYGPQNGEETRIELDQRRIGRWATSYGVGSGVINVQTDDVTQEYLTRRLSEFGANLQPQLDHLKRVALNTTSAHFQMATLLLSKDRDGFFFQILNPRGRTTLNGGVVDHGSAGSPEWSVHT